MILCYWSDHWFLCTGINRERGTIGLRCGRNMWHPSHFQPLPPVGAVFYGSVPFDSDAELYPHLSVQNRLVTPVHWHSESAEPLLLCRLETQNFGAKDERDYLRIVEQLRHEGWQVDIMEGAFKYIHVHDLKKTPGSPPEGAF